LSTGFTPDRGAVSLPRFKGLSEAGPGAACLMVQRRVSPTSGEELAWRFSERNGEVHDLSGPDSIYFEVLRIVDVDPERLFLLRIDAGVRYGVVDDLLETLRKAGVRNVVMGARPADASGS
jgi:hypothetical protein